MASQDQYSIDNGDNSGHETYRLGTAGVKYERLAKSIVHSYQSLAPFRTFNRNMIKEYTGPNYGSNTRRTKYLNKIQQAVDAYTILLAANRPQVKITTEHTSLRGFAKHFEINVNNMIKEIDLEQTIRQWVLDAFLCVGIIKTHRADSGLLVFEGDVAMDPGTPFASNVLLDDWVHDENGRKMSEITYCGDMYQISHADLMQGVQDGIYDESVAVEVARGNNEGFDERIDEMTKDQGEDGYAFSPVVDLADIWLPEEGDIVTFPVADRNTFRIKPTELARMPWDACEEGNYFMLGFGDVPGNIMPTSPVAHFEALDRLSNSTFRKQARRVHRSKEHPIYTPAGAEAMKNIANNNDGESVLVNSLDDVGTYKQGGADPNDQAFLHDTLGLLNVQGGNIEALLGLSAQAETVGQEQLIHSTNSRKGGQMQYRVLDASTKLITCLGKMLWDDEFKTIASTIPINGSPGRFVDSTWEPGDREGNFLQYNFDINVHSMAYQPPAKRVETINMLLQQIYIPLQEMLMQQGGTFDLSELADIHAEMLNIPRLKNVIKFMGQEGMDNGVGPQVSTRKPQNTTRNYVRRNVPTGGTADSRRQVAMQNWLGNDATPQQADAQQRSPAASGVQ